MALKVTNNASTTIAGSINSSVTAINLAGGTGSRFPTLSGGDWFWGTLVDASNNIEVVKVTARSTDALTVVRAQDGTTAKSYTVGDRFELRPTAALFNDKADKDNPSFTTGITTPAITLGATALTPTGTELNYVVGVTSAIQTQLNAKADSSSTTSSLALKANLASPTFTGTPAAPTAAVNTNTTQLATTAFVLAQAAAATPLSDAASAAVGTATKFAREDHVHPASAIGLGQTYQDVTASRTSGVTYTNSTGRSIVISAWGTTGGTTNQRAQCYVAGVLIADNSWYANGPGYTSNAYFLVPPGATYSITFTNVSSITKWFEVR